MYFNPPYSKSVTSNVGANFLTLIDKHFPKNNELSKILNRHTVKVSYMCTPNMQDVINGHNKKVIKDSKTITEPNEDRTCDCRVKNDCPLNGQCLIEKVVYGAKVTQENGKSETYTGMTSTSFKTRYSNHKKSFSCQKYSTETTLGEHVFNLRSKGIRHNITWQILGRGSLFFTSSKNCNLCTLETWFILHRKELATLNHPSDILKPCLHRKKFLLKNT